MQELAYTDIGPVMLLSESSVKDLSSKLEHEVTVEQFRPSIVVSDCEAFDEVRRSHLEMLLQFQEQIYIKKNYQGDRAKFTLNHERSLMNRSVVSLHYSTQGFLNDHLVLFTSD